MKSHPATVTPARIRALAEAYGAEPSRWPEAERVPAQAWIAAHPGEARVLLAEACVLDNLLDAWSLPRPAETLRTRILAPAPAIVREARRRSSTSSSPPGMRRRSPDATTSRVPSA